MVNLNPHLCFLLRIYLTKRPDLVFGFSEVFLTEVSVLALDVKDQKELAQQALGMSVIGQGNVVKAAGW